MPLKSFRVTANLPGEIADIIAARVRQERYPSVSAYLTGLVLFDLYARRPHLLTGTLMREPQWLRDKVIEQLVQDLAENPGARPGGWFEHRIEELLAEKRDSQ